MIDLHTHSTASDGQYSPSTLVKLAAEKGLTALALTDHDTVAGVPEARRTAERLGITFVPGIEISVKGQAPVKELHILGYWVDVDSPVLQAMCAQFQRLRRAREEKIFRYLAEQGVPLQQGQVERFATNGLVARPHFARAMVEAGYVSSVREAFDRYLAVPAFDKIERPKPTPEAGIQCILDAGGIPVLAHPVQTKLPLPELEQLIRTLKEAGLMGLECYYSTHTPQETQDYLGLARSYGLTVTGGSDFHGEKVKPEIALGSGIQGSLHLEDAELLRARDHSAGEGF